ncbi:S-adenosyl-L-methionine-dependent methyltransferase [Chytridium lagenaria]|nr:S-adenosyl-L-methionine-dependent methyltransferase [Chytridium lagenaria]
MTTIQEGSAHMQIPEGESSDVFYNPIQEFNRDMSIAAINTFLCRAKFGRVRVLEALSATGLRAVRYAKECPDVDVVVANDMEREAVEMIERNVVGNGVGGKVVGSCGDANEVMYKSIYTHSEPFSIIDLDPFGTAAPFLDAAVRCVRDGGLLCVTCTDMATLAGSQPESCWAKYGAMLVPNSPACHEMSLRILVGSIQNVASKYKKRIRPLLCCSIDFYVRVFVVVETSALGSKKAASNSSLVLSCAGCKSFEMQAMGGYVEKEGHEKFKYPLLGVGGVCGVCGQKYHELEDYPLYYSLPSLCHVVHCTIPSFKVFCSAILNAGFKVSLSHCTANSIKTDAPVGLMWDILRRGSRTTLCRKR